MPDLLDLLEGWTAEVEWAPLYACRPPFEHNGMTFACTKAEWSAWVRENHLCRDCGTASHLNAGGASPGAGSFLVCDDCAKLDDCLTRKHDRGPEWHVSHWGELHRADEHDALVAAQSRRRARYRAKHPEVVASVA